MPRMWPFCAACSADAPKRPPRVCYYHRMSTTKPATNSSTCWAPLMPQAAHHMHLSHCKVGIAGRCCACGEDYTAHTHAACRLLCYML